MALTTLSATITYYNGSRWVDISSNKVLIYDGTAWVHAGKAYVCNGTYMYYAPFVQVDKTSLSFGSNTATTLTISAVAYNASFSGWTLSIPSDTINNFSIGTDSGTITVARRTLMQPEFNTQYSFTATPNNGGAAITFTIILYAGDTPNS